MDDVSSPDVDLKNASKYLLQSGDILFARTGASVGKTYLYQKKDGKVYYAGFLIRVSVNADISPDFVFQNTLTDNYNRFIKITSQRSGQPGVNAAEYKTYSFLCPSNKAEQVAVGSFFTELDSLIEGKRVKLDKLKKLKLAYLSKMFPKKGARVPEVRFKGFSGDWDVVSLGSVANRVTRKNEHLESTLPLTISAQFGLIAQTQFFNNRVASESIKGYYLIKKR